MAALMHCACVPVEEAERLIDIIRSECANCRTAAQSGVLDGYTCPRHYEAIYRIPMPTLGDLSDDG